MLRRRLLVGLLWRRSALRRRFTPRLFGGLASLPVLRGLHLLFGELLRRVRLLGVTRRMAGLATVLEAVSAPLRLLVALLGLLARLGLSTLRGLVALRWLTILLALSALRRVSVLRNLLARLPLAPPGLLTRPLLTPLLTPARLLVALNRLPVVTSRLLALHRLLALTRLLVAPTRLLTILARLLVALRGAPGLLTARGLLRSDLLRGYLLPRDVIAFVSRLAAVSEARLPVRVESLVRGPALSCVTPGRNRDVLAL